MANNNAINEEQLKVGHYTAYDTLSALRYIFQTNVEPKLVESEILFDLDMCWFPPLFYACIDSAMAKSS